MNQEQCKKLLDKGILQAFADGRLQIERENEIGIPQWETLELLEGGIPPQGKLRIVRIEEVTNAL